MDTATQAASEATTYTARTFSAETTPVFCRRCQRTLTSPVSRARGYGKECWYRMRREVRAQDTGSGKDDRARLLLEDAAAVRLEDGVYATVSSGGEEVYLTSSGSCTCKAGTAEEPVFCYHRRAVQWLEATLGRTETEEHDEEGTTMTYRIEARGEDRSRYEVNLSLNQDFDAPDYLEVEDKSEAAKLVETQPAAYQAAIGPSGVVYRPKKVNYYVVHQMGRWGPVKSDIFPVTREEQEEKTSKAKTQAVSSDGWVTMRQRNTRPGAAVRVRSVPRDSSLQRGEMVTLVGFQPGCIAVVEDEAGDRHHVYQNYFERPAG